MERPGAQVSLIIPVFRDADIVLECLASITDDPGCDGIDIVVVDDASGDDTPDRKVGAIAISTGLLWVCSMRTPWWNQVG